MKVTSILLIIVILIINFGAGFYVTVKLTIPILDKRNTINIENNPGPYFRIIVFTPDGIEIINLTELEEFKRRNSSYSFLIPKGTESYYGKMLDLKYKKPAYAFEVEQIALDRERISLTSDGGKSSATVTYEATEKEIFPKTSKELNLIDAFLTFFAGLIGGAVICFISYFIFRKYRLI